MASSRLPSEASDQVGLTVSGTLLVALRRNHADKSPSLVALSISGARELCKAGSDVDNTVELPTIRRQSFSQGLSF